MGKYELKKDNTYGSKQTNKCFSRLATLPKFILDWIDQHLNELIVVSNNQGEVLFVSKSVELILGYQNTELLNKAWSDKITKQNLIFILKNLPHKHDTQQVFTINILNKKNEYIRFKCSTTKIIDETNNKSYFISSLKDISQHKKIEEVMIQSEKMSVAGQLAAGIAHEIRNPLTSLKGFLQLLQAEGKGKEAYFKVMIDEIDKIETITSELLFISKPMTNYKKLESIESMIKDVIILLKSQAKMKSIELKLIQQKEVLFHCDRSQMKQVLINLVKNAIEAMEVPGTIKIEVNKTKAQTTIDVIDEGPGIHNNIIQELTTPFFTTKEHGTGLGLMITQQILDQHEANIEVIQNENNGSTFRITLPETSNLN